LFAAELGEVQAEAAEVFGQCGREPAGRAEISEVLDGVATNGVMVGSALRNLSRVSSDRERIAVEVVVVMPVTLGTGPVRAHRQNAPSGAPFADGAFGRCTAGPGSLASTRSIR
jgi:hypothetical protein